MSAKITYNPGISGDPEKITMFGQQWEAGKMVSVDDDMATRLLGHPHFVRNDQAQAREDAENLAKAQAEAERIEAEKRMTTINSKK